MSVSKFCGNTLPFSLLLFVDRMGAKFRISLSDLYARWEKSDGGGGLGSSQKPGAESIETQTVKLDRSISKHCTITYILLARYYNVCQKL